jgi:hypothetical protein
MWTLLKPIIKVVANWRTHISKTYRDEVIKEKPHQKYRYERKDGHGRRKKGRNNVMEKNGHGRRMRRKKKLFNMKKETLRYWVFWPIYKEFIKVNALIINFD